MGGGGKIMAGHGWSWIALGGFGRSHDLVMPKGYNSHHILLVITEKFKEIIVKCSAFGAPLEGRSKGSSSVSFEVLIINCQTCF